MRFTEINNRINSEKNVVKKTAMKAATMLTGAAPVIAAGAAIENREKIKDEIGKTYQQIQMKKYSPVTLEEFESPSFRLPNMIRIVDDADYKGIKVCNGSIGGRQKTGEMEVFYLYDEEVNNSKIKFVPNILCDSVYYKDPYHNNTFIQVEDLYSEIQHQKISELSHIAYCLGAKSYSIDLLEDENESIKFSEKSNTSAKVKIVDAEVSEEYERETENSRMSRSRISETFLERREPVQPELCVFKHDHIILDLVNQVLNNSETLVSRDIVLEGSSTALMSYSTAAKIDAAIKKMGASVGVSIKKQTKHELSKKMIFHLEF